MLRTAKVAGRRVSVAAAFGVVLGLGLSTCGAAQSLNETLAAAYRSNPSLHAERARLRAVDENVALARSGFLPTVGASVAGRIDNTQSSTTENVANGINGESRSNSYGVAVHQPVFRGFRTVNAVNQAEASRLAGQETLRTAEQTVLLAAVTAHMDVVTSLRLVQASERSVSLLRQLLSQTERRFKDSDVTQTDVALSRSRFAGATVTLEAARANYKASRARFEEVVGLAPANLRYPRLPLRLLPPSLEAALDAANEESPIIGAAYFREIAAHHAANTITGELLPEIGINGSYSHEEITGAGAGITNSIAAEIRMSVPIFDGGAVRSRVRQAKHIQYSLRQEVEQYRNQVRQQTISVWSIYSANSVQAQGRRVQLQSVEIALKGLREEEALGQRTVGNVLDGLQEVINAQVGLALIERDTIVNAYAVLASVGRLTMNNIAVIDEQEIYRPEEHAAKVRHDAWTTAVTYGDKEPDKRRSPAQ